ncbi:MAG TPA: hypothetical protein G4N96_13165 [Chloroflexi bacterium]|nr:MAG: hypothetical protein B6243_08460 [Anaerolineaceae bacterium 4572_5.2]HEY86051.1 hypothetical protein [Chloroflexota bacterium]
MTTILNFLNHRMRPLFAALLVLLALLLWFSPAEKTLGQAVKLVYLHGALVRSAVVLFLVSLPVNLAALFSPSSMRKNWLCRGKALVWGAIAVWLAHTLFSMVTTYATWGIFIAWSEPRTRFTFTAAGVSLLLVVAAYLIDSPRFSALVFVALAGVVVGLLPQLGLLRHPFDPIATSSSTAIRAFYAAILTDALAMSGLLVVWIRNLLCKQQ